ncbi:MAG: pyrroloquinoline quinone-dependent dehydrogenase [Caulobacteraceae bacterium]|nr:pyrroloquinoline quinone-dependent dehydrogenase [Caulobacteraceae bacterium]
MMRLVAVAALAVLALAGCGKPPSPPAAVADVGWAYYGGDAGGQRFSPAAQITPANVDDLKTAWTWSSGELAAKGEAMDKASFEGTPIMVEGRLYICTPFNMVAALDPGTGKELWRFDPRIDPTVNYPNDVVCRGVAFWRDPQAPPEQPCAARIFTATNDRRLIALDAASGRLCPGFGAKGTVDVGAGVVLARNGGMQITSAPVIAGDVVVVGSSIDDNQRVDEVRGTVRAYDARDGRPLWSFAPLAQAGPDFRAGAANVWAPMSVDEARGLVVLPTSSASPDFYGSARKGDGRDANSVVALEARTGRRVWGFQTTHHDVWDYDVPAQPTLAEIDYGGRRTAAVLQPTKQGLLFTLDRQTGAPVIPVVERPVPQAGAPGEALSPTQPFPIAPKPRAPSDIAPKQAYGLTPWDRGACEKLIAGAQRGGLYTPPSLKGSLVYPFTGGGVNWGGLAFDPRRGVAIVNTSSALHKITLIPAAKVDAAQEADFEAEISPQTGAPYGMKREVVFSPLGLPCNPPPWGMLHAVDMKTGKVLWEIPLGTTRDLAPLSQFVVRGVGTPNFGGPIVTGGGLVFIGAAMDDYLRAFDIGTGKELWKGRLPAGGQATPMTYVWKGRQFVVIAAGGHSKSDTRRGDQLVAFALPG